MSVYRPKRKDGSYKSPYYQFDFVIKINGERRRVFGSTEETTKTKAQDYERAEKQRLKSERPNDHMTLAAACDRYYEEVAKTQPSADDTAIALEHCVRLLGGARRLVNITANDIANAVRRRSAETYGKKKKRLVSAATVNRQIVEPLERVMRRAHRTWDMSCEPDRIDWRKLAMKEPKERVREFTTAEADAFWQELRADYAPFVWFLATRGLRVRATIGLEKAHVDLPSRKIRIWKKGEGDVWVPIGQDHARLIAAEMARSPTPYVWTFEHVRRPMKGMRSRITYSGFRRVIRNAFRAAGVADFRIHDLRHDFASKLLRRTRDLALVQKSLGHADIQSTVKYAHILDEDIAQGLDSLTESRIGPGIAPGKTETGV